MSTSPNAHTPIPRQPIGATFIVAISVLGAVAIIEFIAVVWHYIPLLRQQATEPAGAQPLAQSAPVATPPPTPQPTATPSAEMHKAQKLIAEADRSLRVGDFENGLKVLEELGKLMPGDPTVQLRKAQVLERLDQPAEAVLLLEEALRHPGLPQEVRTQAQAKVDHLSQRLAGQPSTTPAPEVAAPLPETAGGIFVTTLVCSRAPASELLMRVFETADPAPNP